MAVLPGSMPLELPCPQAGCGARVLTTAKLRIRKPGPRRCITLVSEVDPSPLDAHVRTHREAADA